MEITVLRFGHRKKRDERASTHVALTARALGAENLVYCGEKDLEFETRIKKVVDEWGGEFEIEYVQNWQEYIKKFQGTFVHLTMYGERIEKKIVDIKQSASKFLVLVGSQKVGIEAYQLANFNIAVTNQPHSEIAALAIFLDKLQDSKQLQKIFNGEKTVIPCKMGKKVKTCK